MDTASTLVLGDDVATLDDVAQEPSGSEDETSTEDGSDEDDGHVENDLVTPPKRPAADTEASSTVKKAKVEHKMLSAMVPDWARGKDARGALDRKSAAKSDDFRPDDLDNMDPEEVRRLKMQDAHPARPAAANGATSFRESMGMLGDAEDKAKRPVVTPDTVKLPPCGNPIGWGKLKVVFSVRLPQSLDRRPMRERKAGRNPTRR